MKYDRPTLKERIKAKNKIQRHNYEKTALFESHTLM